MQFSHFQKTLQKFLIIRILLKQNENNAKNLKKVFFLSLSLFFFKKYFTVLRLSEYELPASHVANVSVSWRAFLRGCVLPLWKCQRSGFVHGDENAQKQDE